MRFLVREQGYERAVASGQLRYSRDGAPTGVVESWRLNEAVQGYRVLRVDLDGRAAGADSLLLHLLLDPAGQPERLTFRAWAADGGKLEGNLFFDADQLVCGRTRDGERLPDVHLPRPEPLRWWYPAGTGLAAFAELTAGTHELIYLDPDADFAPRPVLVSVGAVATDGLDWRDRPVPAQKRTISWAQQTRTIWFDEHNWPRRINAGAWQADEVRYVRRNN
ncbi:MAG: hypothetical protein KDE04_15635 [Anaerolineales bacterium]|nr:hypothetical protein [Anaerolineales bacterium]